MTSLALDDARPRDAADLLSLEQAIFPGDRLTDRSFRRFIRSGGASLRVVRADGEVAGYALVLFRSNALVARLYSLAVGKDHQGQGIGSALIEDAERIARERGAARLRLEVREDNPGARRLYESLGFRLIGRRPDYYADGMAAIRLEKQIRRPQRRAKDMETR